MRVRSHALLCTALALGTVAGTTGAAHAGGFAIREQSAHFQGSSFAGNAAGGALSSMFWNPAAVGQFNGINTESTYSWIIPDSEITALPGSTLLGFGAESGNVGNQAIVPSSYLSYQISPSLVLGFSFGAPFGLSTEPENRVWAGMTHARTSKIETYNLQSVLAWRVTPTFIVGAGLQIERMEGTLKSAVGAPGFPNAVIRGDDTAFGWTLGALWHATPTTTLGLGFRSSIEHNLEGGVSGAFPVHGDTEAGLKTPEIVTLSLRQEFGPRWTGLASVEWSNWSRLQSLDVECTSPTCGGGGTLVSLPLGWHDGWFFSVGAEYAWSPALTLRGGVAYEMSPIQNADERPARLPDADRIWASLGATYKWSERISVDLAYSHIFVDDSSIDRTENGIRLLADVESSVDILSVGLKIKLGEDAPPPPLK